jgi:hypothetical protein
VPSWCYIVLGREASTTATFRNTHVQSPIYLCFPQTRRLSIN